VKATPRSDRRHRVARLIRSAILRLKQVDIPAASDIERMPVLAEQAGGVAHERQSAIAYRASEHGSSVANAQAAIRSPLPASANRIN
jgi:hypothetical protein